MTTYPQSLTWHRLGPVGIEQVLFRDQDELTAEGTVAVAGDLPYTLSYSLLTDARWRTQLLEVSARGAGWRRTVRVEHRATRWQVTTAAEGHLDDSLPGIEDPRRLDAAVDVDLGWSPFTNTLPIRRLQMLAAPVGTVHRLTMVFVRVPSLEVVPRQQMYTVLGDGRVGYASREFSTVLEVTPEGFVTDYPGVATRAPSRTPV